MASRLDKDGMLKIVSLFSVVRGYNIPIIILAQYFSAIFILSPKKAFWGTVLDFKLFILVIASAITIASGYIINNFYDSSKDLINRPNKSMLDRLVSQRTKLNVYFLLNFIVAIITFLFSWRAFLFFSFYIFLIWFYSHKMKKQPIIGNIASALLAIFPFFAILLYYYIQIPFKDIENYKSQLFVIFSHASFLFLLLLVREMIKDLENITGDLANGYKTVPIVYGEESAKRAIAFLTSFTVIPVYFLIEKYDVGYMDIYFYSCLIVLLFFLIRLKKARKKPQFIKLHILLKFLIVAGVFSIALINPSILWR